MDGARPHLLPASEHFISFSRRIRRASAVNLSKKIEAVSAELAGYLCINGGTIKIENLEVLLEDISSKFSLVLEGHEVLRSEIRELGRKTDERFDLVDFKIDILNKKIDAVDEKLSRKIDAVSAELAAHRSDTEAHHGMYRVKEG
jgi:hypothetical protein